MRPGLRKCVLAAHITTSVGWLGGVVTYLALDVTATASQDVQTVRAAYLAMGVIVTYVIVPLALASVLIGVVNALGTPWGLFRHYWVLVKLLLTVLAATVLLIEGPTVDYLAEEASTNPDPRELGGTLLHSIGGSVVLLISLILSVYKPPGITRYGWHTQQEQRRRQREQRQAPVRSAGSSGGGSPVTHDRGGHGDGP